MQELAERISHWGRENQEKEVYEHRTETQCLRKVFLILIFKTKKKQLRRSSLMSAFAFDLIFLYYFQVTIIIVDFLIVFLNRIYLRLVHNN